MCLVLMGYVSSIVVPQILRTAVFTSPLFASVPSCGFLFELWMSRLKSLSLYFRYCCAEV